MRPATLAELAAGAGIAVPEVHGFGSFTAFAGMYLAACDVLTTYAAMERLVEEMVADAAADERCGWSRRSIWGTTTTASAHRGKRSRWCSPPRAGPRRAHGIAAGVIVSADRTKDPEVALADRATRR